MLRKVLSNYGGGIRGIIQCEFWSYIESLIGRRVAETFDLMAGTSTGGIGTLAMALPGPGGRPFFSAGSIGDFYREHGATIFDRDLFDGLGGLTDERYPCAGLERVLNDYFGDTIMAALVTNVMVPTYAPEDWKILVLKSWKMEHGPVMCKHAARATSAAPTYFEPAKIRINTIMKSLIDGGLNLNNPSMSAYAEARLLWPEDDILVVSVGTGVETETLRHEDFKDWGVSWLPYVIKIAMSGQEAHHQLRKLQGAGDVTYFHFQTDLINADDAMDNTDPENLKNLERDAGSMIYENREKIDHLCDLIA